MTKLNIAVIGSGISGLSAAWLLSKKHNVTLFEKNHYIGGHTNTIDVDTPDGIIPVDTGFICFNELCYPNLTALFAHLDVETQDTVMGFAASLHNGDYEYSGDSFNSLFGQRRNIFKQSHWSMVRGILRFFKEAPQYLEGIDPNVTIGEILKKHGYSKSFADLHLLPMAAAIWSSSTGNMLDYPAEAFIRFFRNHGLLQVYDRPIWRTVKNGSREYVKKLISDGGFEVLTHAPVDQVVRSSGDVKLAFLDKSRMQQTRSFDQVVFASHADQSLKMLDAPSDMERELLGAFKYSKNKAVLHFDKNMMPKRRRVWTSWNYIEKSEPNSEPHLAQADDADFCVTYWMNMLQSLPTSKNVFVTLNPPENYQPDQIVRSFDYEHPIFDAGAMQAQRNVWRMQGENRTWYCGAFMGAGFHEDGIQAGLAVAEALGGVRRPWDVANESGRIYLGDTNNGSEPLAAE